MKPLKFSSASLGVYAAALTGRPLALSRPSIVVNLSDTPVVVAQDKSNFLRLESRLLTNTSVGGQGATVVVIQTGTDDFLIMPDDTRKAIKSSWSYSNPLAEDTDQHGKMAVHKSNILKTCKDTVNGYQLFFCYLPANGQGRIHRIHDLYEQHTQIMGIGKMEKYKEESYASVFETTSMAPGYTHYPYCGHDRLYPWHGYIASTDSVWLAIVRYA